MMKRFLRWSIFLLAAGSIVIGFGCGGSPEGPETPNKILPTISSFKADPSMINSGEYSTLSWSTSNATSCSIDHGIGTVSTSGSYLVDPTETTTYTLTATNADGNATKTCEIEVVAADIKLKSYEKQMTSYHCPEIVGTVKNEGTGPGYNVMITFKAWNDSNTIIDTANGFPADLATIPAGASATFDAVFFNLNKWAQVYKLTWEISWLNGTSSMVRVRVTGVIY
jgi:hypothetical protein